MQRPVAGERTPLGRTSEQAAIRVVVRGVVQGVGFRPFVWRLATGLGLEGQVRNVGGAVEILVQGRHDAIDQFQRRVVSDAPRLAQVDGTTTSVATGRSWGGFSIVASQADAADAERTVAADAATCPSCVAELFDPADRRYRYPFLNCADCGPRFTIIDDLPYDRPRTSMAEFSMCRRCADEYADPANRRYHAEPIACHECGPRLELQDSAGGVHDGEPISGAALLLDAGLVVAIKGLGGFQLACDALDEGAVARLRRRKRRPDKPLAVMVADLGQARALFELGRGEEELLASWRSPITLVRDRGVVARSVAPGHRRQGVMLPSTPLHHLLLAAVGRPLVVTSGNRSDEAICVDDVDARERLSGVADAFLTHDRRIVARYDDSVAAMRFGAPALLRRARGFAPDPLRLPVRVGPTLAVGAELQATFCLASGDRAHVSQHIGDLDSDDTLTAFFDALDRNRRLFGIHPELVAHDLHPDLASTRFAEALGLERVPVQHHHAHVVSVMAEHDLRGPVIGVAFDGFGLGWDGTGWGGEFFVADWAQALRVGCLRPVAQPGGDAAVRHPWRMALAHADAAGRLAAAQALLGEAIPARAGEAVLAQARRGVAAPRTSSAGRLFDSIAALAGVCTEATYEGQPAMQLEQAADAHATGPLRYSLVQDGDRFEVDTRPLVAHVIDLLIDGRPVAEVAGRFHHAMAAIIVDGCRLIRDGHGLTTVCLGGGVFANDLLSTAAARRLTEDGFAVHLPRALPPGDGGLCLGQTLVAHASRS